MSRRLRIPSMSSKAMSHGRWLCFMGYALITVVRSIIAKAKLKIQVFGGHVSCVVPRL